jgi:O-antigen/teichoic acid export membrane protein
MPRACMRLATMTTSSKILQTFARQSLATLMRLGFIVLAARALGPAANGQYALAMLLPTLLTSFLNLGIPAADVYCVASGKLDLASAFRLNLKLWTWLTAAGVFVVALTLVLADALLPGLSGRTIAIAALLFPIMLGSTFMAGLVQAREDFSSFNKALSVTPVLSLLLLAAAWITLTGNITPLHVLLIQLASEIATLACFWLLLRTHVQGERVQPSDTGIRQLLSFGGTVHIGNVLMQLSYRLDLFLVNLFLGSAATGVYYIGVRVTEQVWLAAQPISTVLLPRLSAQDPRDPPIAPMAIRLALYSALAVGLGLLLVVRPAVAGLFGSAYDAAAEVVLLLLPGALLLSGARIACVAMTARGRPDLNLRVNIVVFALNVGLNLVLIPRLGMPGAAVATSLSYALGTVYALVLWAALSGESLLQLLVFKPTDLEVLRRAFTRRKP